MIDSHQDYTVLVSPSGYAAAILYRKPHGHDRITIILASRRVSTPRCGSVQSAQWRSDVTFMVCDAQGAFWSYDITQDISLKNDKIDSDIPQHWNAVTRVPKPAQLFTFKCGSSKFTSSASGSSICCWDGACIGMADPARESYEVISTRSFSLLSCLRLNASGKLIAFLSPQEGLFIMRVTTGKTLPIHIAEEDIENNLPVSPGTGNSSAFVGIEFAGSKHLAILTHHRLYLIQISDRSITTSVSLSQDSGYITPVTFTLDETIACVLMRPVGGNSQSGGNLTRFVDLLSGKLLTTYTLPSSPEAISLRDRTLTAVWLLSASLYRVHFAYDWSVKGTTGNSGSEMVHRTDQMSPALTNHDHKQLSNLSDLLNTMPKLGIHGGRALDVDDEYEKEHELSTSCSGLFAENINWQTRVEMCEAVRNLTWPQCIRLAERCTEAVKWNANQCWCRATEWCYCLMQTRPNLCLRNTQMLQKILTPVTREAQQRCSVDILTYCDRIVGLCDMLGVESIPSDRFNDSGSSNLKGSGSSKTTPKVIHKSIASLLHDPYVLSLMKGAS